MSVSRIWINETRWEDYFWVNFDHVWIERNFFEAAGWVVKICWSLKSNHHKQQIYLVQIRDTLCTLTRAQVHQCSKYSLSYLRIIESIDIRRRFGVCPDQRSNQTDRLGNLMRLLRTLWFGGQTTSSAFEAVRPHNFLHHADRQTLLKSTKLAPVSSSLVHRAIFVRQADVLCVLLNCSLEKSFATFAGSNPVVLASSVVATHGAQEWRFALCFRSSRSRCWHSRWWGTCWRWSDGAECWWGWRTKRYPDFYKWNRPEIQELNYI